LATFTATELVTMEDFVFYTVITSMVASDRAILDRKARTVFDAVFVGKIFYADTE
jgi:hypothetical protein